MKRMSVLAIAAVAVAGMIWREQRLEPRQCAATLKTLAGAVEMYNLDK